MFEWDKRDQNQDQELLAQCIRSFPRGDIPPERRQELIDNPNLLSRILYGALSGVELPTSFVWHGLELGGNLEIGAESGVELRRAVYKNQCAIGAEPDRILMSPDFKIIDQKIYVEFTVASVAELDLRGGANFFHIMVRANKLGLGFCPHKNALEIAMQVLIQYKKQPVSKFVTLLMESINSESEGQRFCLSRTTRDRYLGITTDTPPGYIFRGNDHFLFLRSDDTRLLLS